MGCWKRLYSWYKSTDPEIRRYRKNWILIFNAHFLAGFAYALTFPSLHQFVTSKSTSTDAKVQPGLGLSETWYSWIVGVSSIGEITAAITIAILLRCSLYAKHLMLIGLAVGATGGILYGIGKNGWMLLMGRLCIGLYLGCQMTITRAYLGETSTTVTAMLPLEKQKKSKIKQTNIFIAFTVAGLPFVICPALAAIAAEIPGLDQFRWPGYWFTVHATLVAISLIPFFKEERSDMKKEKFSCVTRQLPVPIITVIYLIFAYFVVSTYFTLLETLQNPIQGDQFGLNVKYTSYVFLGTQTLIIGGNIVMYLLQKFGLSNRILCLMSLLVCTSGTILASDWQAIGGDPCDHFNSSMNVSSAECYPCFHSKTPYIPDFDTNETYNVTLSQELVSNYVFTTGECTLCSTNSTDSTELMRNFGLAVSDLSLICLISENTSSGALHCYWWFNKYCFNITLTEIEGMLTDTGSGSTTSTWPTSCNGELLCNSTLHSIKKEGEQNSAILEFGMESATTDCLSFKCSSQTYNHLLNTDRTDLDSCDSNTSCICESFSGPPYNCFWNPNSRITGEYCPRCEPLCRSSDHSLNFIQFAVGVSLITLAFPVGRATLTLITSDAMGHTSQGLVMGILVSAGSAARLSGPLWGDAVYVAVGRRTYLVMSILSSLMMVVIVLFALLYRSMKPKAEYLTPVGIAEDAELDDAVDYSRSSDRVELLRHFQVEETESEISNTDTVYEEEHDDVSSHLL